MASLKRVLLGSLVGAGLLLVPIAGAPFVLAGNPCYHGYDIPELTVSSGSHVNTEPCAFEPTVTVISAGDSVTFRNGQSFAHLVTGANSAWGDRDIELAPNATVAYTFTEPGVYPYACTLHPGMSGAIVVGDGGPALAAAFVAAKAGGGVAPADAGAAAPVGATTAAGPDPLVVASIAGLVGAAVALAVILVVVRTRPSQPSSESVSR